ncbi:hypothetical protein SDC9_162639 [bioreactor metagenome]|uniref:Uncharacterized protein n=1 Tax=bioreactor metagenome TaxID=1076179 RepID=A0A645FPM5_9ZZZZ
MVHERPADQQERGVGHPDFGQFVAQQFAGHGVPAGVTQRDVEPPAVVELPVQFQRLFHIAGLAGSFGAVGKDIEVGKSAGKHRGRDENPFARLLGHHPAGFEPVQRRPDDIAVHPELLTQCPHAEQLAAGQVAAAANVGFQLFAHLPDGASVVIDVHDPSVSGGDFVCY